MSNSDRKFPLLVQIVKQNFVRLGTSQERQTFQKTEENIKDFVKLISTRFKSQSRGSNHSSDSETKTSFEE